MRETRLSGSEGGAGSIPVPTPIVADALRFRFRQMFVQPADDSIPLFRTIPAQKPGNDGTRGIVDHDLNGGAESAF